MSDPTQKEITELIKRFTQAEGRKNHAWSRVMKTAKDWALMHSLGKYIDERGGMITVGHNDREDYEQMFIQRLKTDALDALAQEACALDP